MDVEHTTHVTEGNNIGDETTYTCDFTGETEDIECQSDGTWSPLSLPCDGEYTFKVIFHMIFAARNCYSLTMSLITS